MSTPPPFPPYDLPAPVCGNCGQPHTQGAHYCERCGAPLTSAPAPQGPSAPADHQNPYSQQQPPMPPGQYMPPAPWGYAPQPGLPPHGQDFPPGFQPLHPPTPPRRSRTPLVIAALCVALVAIGGLVFAMMQTDSTPRHTAVAPSLAAGLTRYEFPEGHFAAGFVNKPVARTIPGSFAGATYNLVAVGDAESRTVVESEEITPGLPADQRELFLNSAMTSFTLTGKLKMDGQKDTTFRGMQGRTATYRTSDGGTLTGMVVVASAQRAFVFLAPSGTTFDNLLASFEELG